MRLTQPALLFAIGSVQALEVTQLPIKNYRDQVYLVPLKIENQEFQAVLDTGSSDTWLASSRFKCATAQCNFGPGYTKSPAFAAIPGQKFSISYASESVSGVMGTETISLGNVTMKGQSIGVVDRGSWKGDGLSSGLMGLAFPSGSSTLYGYKGVGGKYSPIFNTMQKQGLVAPLFSIALNRIDEGPGALTFGGLPTGLIKFEKKFATTKMQYLTFGNGDPDKKPVGDTDPRLYRMTIDELSYGGKTTGKMQINVDSGTAFSTVPKDVARAFNAGWVPKARFDRALGWAVDCNAKAPKFGVKINGVTFNVSSKDLIIPPEQEGSSACSSAVQEGTFPGSYLLGASFLRNVVAVFDVGKMEMRFANRIR